MKPERYLYVVYEFWESIFVLAKRGPQQSMVYIWCPNKKSVNEFIAVVELKYFIHEMNYRL